VLPTGALLFGLQATHAASAEAPVVVNIVSAAQSVHTALPLVVLYLPATHEVHVPPSGPVNPTLHVQAARAELEVGELEYAGQLVHDAVPDVLLYFSASHAVHEFAAGHVVSVRSKPPVISAAIAVSVASVMYSSTKKKPAMSPLNLAVVSAAEIEPSITEVLKSGIAAVDIIQKMEGLVT